MKSGAKIIISVILLVAMMSQIPLQASAQMSSEQGETGEIIIFTEASPLREPVYISIGFLAGLWYLSKNVPQEVSAFSVISMLGHGLEQGKGAGYILEIASSYLPKEDWVDGYPYPISVNESKGRFSVHMDSRFLNKDFCLEYAKTIIKKQGDGDSFHGMSQKRIAVEIYGHAVIHYAIYFIRLTPLYKLMKNTIDDFYSSSDPIDVNYNESKFRMIIFNMIW